MSGETSCHKAVDMQLDVQKQKPNKKPQKNKKQTKKKKKKQRRERFCDVNSPFSVAVCKTSTMVGLQQQQQSETKTNWQKLKQKL